MEGCPDFRKTGSFSCLGASAQGAGISFDAYLEACWGALWGRRLEGTIFVLYRTPASGHHLSFFFFFCFLFSFSFFFPSGHHLYTLPLSLPPPAGGHHLCAFPQPHSRVPASPRGKLLHTSGAPVFTSGAPIFAAARGWQLNFDNGKKFIQ